MSTSAIWPCFACMALLLAIAAVPVFRPADAPPNPRGDRISTLDGLRGYLALSVFFHHAYINHEFRLNGTWEMPASTFYMRAGVAGVSLFFMVTGYLFWNRLISEKVRSDWLQLYIGRVFRIGPVYLIAVASMLIIVFVGTGLKLAVPVDSLAEQIGSWFALGYLPAVDINGFPRTSLVLAGVTWTLHYEWLFYASLPLIAPAARRSWHLTFATGGFLLCLVNLVWPFLPGDAIAANAFCLFFAGMACASLQKRQVLPGLPDWLASLITCVFLVAAFASPRTLHQAEFNVLLAIPFYLISSGCTVFGLLTCRPARRLGNVSYGVYLLQGLVLWLVFSSNRLRMTALASDTGHWVMVMLCAVLLITTATLVHAVVERPGIQLGKHAYQIFRTRSLRSHRAPVIADNRE